jgi:hypothetical protein
MCTGALGQFSGIGLASKALGTSPGLTAVSPALAMILKKKPKDQQRYGGGDNGDGSISFAGR